MRVSTNQFSLMSIRSMLEQQAEINKTQLQISSGKKILSPADDPAAAARILELNKLIETTQQYQKNADAAHTRLAFEESALANTNTTLQRVREIAVQAGNTILTNNDRRALAQELHQLLDTLVSTANSVDNNGDYLFSGFQASTRPFVTGAAGTIAYAGDDGQRMLQIGQSRQVADGDSGQNVFRAIRNGNGTFVINEGVNNGSAIIDQGSVSATYVPDTYTITFTEVTPGNFTYTVTDGTAAVIAGPQAYQENAVIDLGVVGIQTSVHGTPADGDSFVITPSANQDVFQTVRGLINNLETGFSDDTQQATYLNSLNRSLIALDNSIEHISGVRARVGTRMNSIDNQVENNDTFILQAQETLSLIQDLDYTEAATRFNVQLTALQAAQQTFARVQNLSLFNFL